MLFYFFFIMSISISIAPTLNTLTNKAYTIATTPTDPHRDIASGINPNTFDSIATTLSQNTDFAKLLIFFSNFQF